MPRIDPLQLLNCLQILLSSNGGILSKDEVTRLASLMTKFSKKLVSKCVYVLILKNTERTLLGEFMAAGGWTLIQLWLHDAMYSTNWALVQELLILLLVTPVDVERLKSNNIPKLVKSLSKREDLQEVHELSNQLVQQWLRIVKDETQSELSQKQQAQQSTPQPVPEPMQESTETVDSYIDETVDETSSKDDVEMSNAQIIYKYSHKDGKHLISKVGSNEPNVELENIEVIEMKDDDDIKDKEKEKEKEKSKEKKHSNERSKHKSSSKRSTSSSNKDKDKSKSHKDKSRHNSSSKDKERSKDKDKNRNNGIVKNKSPSAKDKDKDKDKKQKQPDKEKESKDTSTKPLQPQSVLKLPKIPKKVDDKDKKKEEPKKGTMSIEVRKTNEERPKTVKVYKAKMRSTGLEEEAKPAPPRPVKKPNTAIPVIPPPPLSTLPLKRASPIRELSATPLEKKLKIETPAERPGAIKLIPPKPKPPVLQESDMFMDALTASATTKKEPKKRKRRASVSKDSAGTSPPNSPNISVNGTLSSPIGLKNITPPKFYQDTLETDENKPASEETQNDTENERATMDVAVPSIVSDVETPVISNSKSDEPLPPPKSVVGLKSVLLYGKRNGPKKSIKWKPDEELVEIQYFELDETERVNVSRTFGDMAKMDVRGEREAIQMSRKLQNEDVMDVQTPWKIPTEIDIPSPLVLPGSKSLEKDIQFAREKSVLQDVYFKHLLPETPTEPDPESYQIQDPITIPIDDIENPDHDFRNTPWPEPKGSPPPPNIANNIAPSNFHNVQMPYQNFNVGPPPAQQQFQNIQQQFPNPHFMPPNVIAPPIGEWNNVQVPPHMQHPPQMMPPPPRNMPPEMINQGPMNPNMYMPPPPPENFNHMMNDGGHRFPPPFNQQGPAMYPPNNFNNRGGHGYNHGHGHGGHGGGGGFRRGGGGGGNGPWLRMNGPAPGNWGNRGGGGPPRTSGRLCNNIRNKGFCKNRENCLFFHPPN